MNEENESSQIIIRIDPTTKMKFQIAALQQNVTMSALIRDFIDGVIKASEITQR